MVPTRQGSGEAASLLIPPPFPFASFIRYLFNSGVV